MNNSITSENLGLTGTEDLFEAVLPVKMRPSIVSTVSGKIKNIAEKPVSTKLVWNDVSSEKNIGVLYSDPADGSYYLVLPHGKFYQYYAQDDSLLNESYHLDLKSEINAKHIENNMRLFKIEELVNSGEALRLNNVFFNFDESTLLPASITELIRWAEIIKKSKLKVEISGHTDSVGEEQYNQKLSEKRAEAVRMFLISQGCNPELLQAIGYGKSMPVNSNDTEKGRALNRRVELKITGLM
jgi:outer membrane protein OmpA-like peptidoglycan-associated protein